jgi:hypothetical protein
VQAVWAAFRQDPGIGTLTPLNLAMLREAVTASGMETGGYDDGVLAWLANFEPHVCAAVAGMITRAFEEGWYAARRAAMTDSAGIIDPPGKG